MDMHKEHVISNVLQDGELKLLYINSKKNKNINIWAEAAGEQSYKFDLNTSQCIHLEHLFVSVSKSRTWKERLTTSACPAEPATCFRFHLLSDVRKRQNFSSRGGFLNLYLFL